MALATLQPQAIALTEISQLARDIKPQYVTHPLVSVEGKSSRLDVIAINQAGVSKHFNVCVPLSIAYRPQMAAQSTLAKVLSEGWTVISALATGDRF